MKYDCKFEIRPIGEAFVWWMKDHKGAIVVRCPEPGYTNWHNAKRAMDRHIKVIQSAQFTLPPKPLRKEYTFKKQNHVHQS